MGDNIKTVLNAISAAGSTYSGYLFLRYSYNFMSTEAAEPLEEAPLLNGSAVVQHDTVKNLNYSLASVLCIVALVVLFTKLIVNFELHGILNPDNFVEVQKGEHKGGRMRHALGTAMLTISSVLLGLNDNNEYFDGVLALFLIAALDRLLNFALTMDSLGDAINHEKVPKFYKWKTLLFLLVSLGFSLVVSLITMFEHETLYEVDSEPQRGVGVAGLIFVGVHLLVVIACFVDFFYENILSLNRIPIVRMAVAGTHLTLFAIQVGHLAAEHLENGILGVSLALLAFVDIIGRDDGKAVA